MADINTQDVHRKVSLLTHQVSELQRKSRGITQANARAATLERQHTRILEELSALQARIDQLGPAAGPTQTSALTAEIERIDGKVDGLWADLNSELDKLRGRVDTHESRLDGHDELFAQLDSANKERDGRVVIIGESVARAHARIDVLQRARQSAARIHPAAYVLGAIAGLIAGMIWAAHDWTQTVMLGDVETVVENTAANTFWAALVCGLAAGLLVLFLVSLVLRDDNGEPDTVITGEADAEAGSAVVIDREAPTRAHPVVTDAPPPPPAANRNAGVGA